MPYYYRVSGSWEEKKSLFEGLHADVVRILRQAGWSRHLAEDAAQDACAAVLTRRDLVSSLSDIELRKYITKCAFNAARDELRRKGRASTREQQWSFSQYGSDPVGPQFDVERCLAAWHRINTLPHALAVAFVRCDLLGFSLHETASHLGVPAGTVSTWLRRARELLLVEPGPEKAPRRSTITGKKMHEGK